MSGVMFAYGSNLNVKQMAQRCPNAVRLGRLRLDNWRIVFRGVADCVREPGAVCYGGVWRITDECERALDIYEGVDAGMYRKEYIPIKKLQDGTTGMLVYCMNSTGIMPPSKRYFGVIRQGYRDFKIPTDGITLLHDALRESWNDKAPSHIERNRHRRNGRPPLAERPMELCKRIAKVA